MKRFVYRSGSRTALTAPRSSVCRLLTWLVLPRRDHGLDPARINAYLGRYLPIREAEPPKTFDLLRQTNLTAVFQTLSSISRQLRSVVSRVPQTLTISGQDECQRQDAAIDPLLSSSWIPACAGMTDKGVSHACPRPGLAAAQTVEGTFRLMPG